MRIVRAAKWINFLPRYIPPLSLKLGLQISHQVFSDDNTPYGPYTFLATTWRASSELAGYAQQDAHEFFISALSQIHATSRGSTEVSCNCVIHSTFAGQLQSDVKCERCKNITTTVDPILDVSLELKGKGGEIASGENSLAACLRRQVLSLPLISGLSQALLQIYSTGEVGIQRIQLRKMWEGSCKISYSHTRAQAVLNLSLQEASKRLSIRRLPPVLSFQLKVMYHMRYIRVLL